MKANNRTLILAATIAGALCLMAPGPARAQQNALPEAVVIIIDGGKITQLSLVGQDIALQIETLRGKIEADITTEQRQLQADGEELQGQFSVLPPAQFEPRRRAYDAKIQAFRRKVEEKQAVVQRALSLANNEIERSMRPILREIMNRRSANFVFDKAQIALSGPEIDVSDEVIEMLDKKLPTLTLDIGELD